ncbi:hypothetical protein SUGI_0730520 [Cryptomeria japonica]|uniref:F-box/kelch-repeat protein At5g15710-like n=1 Tax=Cryptomeria japonica TaxID=3369 RepID=UPI0024148467|nr:F-box/kelch-repeat protein At5g15710-like [Cryptomeria japonica]GLJ36391.1 hypothetical protein SUGI_0730520 [Cryptomeria japonica]
MEIESTEMEHESVTAVEGDREEHGISKLPEEMKRLVFSKLPFESIYSSRTVCKEWNSILSSDNFLSSLPAQNPLLLISIGQINNKCSCITYSFSTQKWMKFPISFYPHTEGCDRNNRVCSCVRDVSSTTQGLLLVEQNPAQQLLVCNPLMRSCVEVEMDFTSKIIRIVRGSKKEPYLIAYSKNEIFSFDIYHYFEDSWRIKLQFAEERGNNILCREALVMVECNGVLFWRERSQATIVGYKIQDEGFISTVTVAPFPVKMVQDLNAHVKPVLCMVPYGSSVLLVVTTREPSLLGETHPSFGGIRPNKTGIVIWELFQDEKDELIWRWKEFARMSPQSLPEFSRDADFWNKCVCVGDYLCFPSLWPCDSLEVLACNLKVYAYNLKGGFWQHVPPCKIQYNKKIRILRMMSFEPSSIIDSWEDRANEGLHSRNEE